MLQCSSLVKEGSAAPLRALVVTVGERSSVLKPYIKERIQS